MKLIPCKTPNEVATKTLIELRRIASDQPERVALFVPTGSTPKPIYGAMVTEGAFWSERLAPIQIDEFVDSKRLFYSQLKAELLEPLHLHEHAQVIDPAWTEVQMFSHIDQVMGSKIDGALLGLGPNGHVGFHEPGYSMTFAGGRLRVSEESRARVKGAITPEVYTFGVQAFMHAREILLVVIGEAKRTILRQVIEASPTDGVPAAYLKLHERLTIISDVLPG